MQNYDKSYSSNLHGALGGIFRRCLFSILSFGPMPNHIAFIMDGNRRYAKSRNIKQSSGHRVGFSALTATLQYCYEMGVKYVTVYAFSVDNFKRKPEEVRTIMDLFQEKIEELLREESIVSKYQVKLNFWGKLDLLSEPVRSSVEKAMSVTSKNSGPVLSVCVAYTSTAEITHAVNESCSEKWDVIQEQRTNGNHDDLVRGQTTNVFVSVTDLGRKLYGAECPDPDILIRTSGETRLSNFLFWQTTFTHLQKPYILWPEFSLRHLVWSILEYQKVQPCLAGGKMKKGS